MLTANTLRRVCAIWRKLKRNIQDGSADCLQIQYVGLRTTPSYSRSSQVRMARSRCSARLQTFRHLVLDSLAEIVCEEPAESLRAMVEDIYGMRQLAIDAMLK